MELNLTHSRSRPALEPVTPRSYLNPGFPKKEQPNRPSGYQLATVKATQDYRDSQSYARKMEYKNQKGEEVVYESYECCVDTSELRKYGLGVYLFFEFVKRLAVTLIIMSAINAVPLFYAYTTGDALSTYKESYMITLAKTSLGNIKNGDQTTHLVFTVCDVLSMIVFFFFYLHWRSFHNQTVVDEEKDVSVLKPSSYALSVIGFEEGTLSLQKQLRNYILSVFGANSIYEVEVVYNYGGYFSKFIHYDELVQKLQKEKHIIEQTKKDNTQMQEIKKQLQECEKELSTVSQTFQPSYAIIHFRTLKAKINFINFCRKYSLIDNFSSNLTRLICCERLPPQNQLFMGKSPLIIKSNNLSRPEQINWQNLDVTGCSKVLRSVFSAIFLIIAILITSSCIALCTLYVSSTSACTDYDPLTQIDDAIAAQGQTLYCFCSVNFVDIYTDPDVKNACGFLQNSILFSNIMQVGASVVSSVSNVLLIVIVSLIAKYILKSDSKPKQYSFIFVAVLISNYINSSILPLIMNGDIFGFQSLQYLKFMDFIDFNRVSVFKDYSTDWYAVVAPYYINFMIIAIIGPFIGLSTTALSFCYTNYKVRKACENSKDDPIIQKQANNMVANQNFNIATEQALVCLFFSIAIMYSSLLPILLPIATLVMIATFICKKAIILRFTVRIPADQALSQKTLTIMPFLILVHFLMGVWSHTAPEVFDQSSYIVKLNTTGYLGENFNRVFLDLIMLGGAAITLVWILFDYTILTFFNFIKQCCFKSDVQIPKTTVQHQSTTFEERLKKTNILGSYKLINHPTFGHAITAFKQLQRRLSKERSKLKSTQQTIQINNGVLGGPKVYPQLSQTNKGVLGGSYIQLNPIKNPRMKSQISMMEDQLNPENQMRR